MLFLLFFFTLVYRVVRYDRLKKGTPQEFAETTASFMKGDVIMPKEEMEKALSEINRQLEECVVIFAFVKERPVSELSDWKLGTAKEITEQVHEYIDFADETLSSSSKEVQHFCYLKRLESFGSLFF